MSATGETPMLCPNSSGSTAWNATYSTTQNRPNASTGVHQSSGFEMAMLKTSTVKPTSQVPT